mmetsp:Transcript_53193/g.127206  ORF Transcript_53193/g.127206 Transcript_53193/m.127206 type:complete len:251 (-) Transcript_53193:81-833(-)
MGGCSHEVHSSPTNELPGSYAVVHSRDEVWQRWVPQAESALIIQCKLQSSDVNLRLTFESLAGHLHNELPLLTKHYSRSAFPGQGLHRLPNLLHGLLRWKCDALNHGQDFEHLGSAPPYSSLVEPQLICPPRPDLLRDFPLDILKQHQIVHCTSNEHRLLQPMKPQLIATACSKKELPPSRRANEPELHRLEELVHGERGGELPLLLGGDAGRRWGRVSQQPIILVHISGGGFSLNPEVRRVQTVLRGSL